MGKMTSLPGKLAELIEACENAQEYDDKMAGIVD
jgi:hypothetical protein